MTPINELLVQFKKISDDCNAEKELISKVFKKTIGFPIKEFKVKNSILVVKENPYIKSEIVIHKTKLLKELKKEGIECEILDIQ